MANPKRGEASFSVGEGASRKEYTLRFSFNVLCSVEKELGMSLQRLMSEWSGGDEDTGGEGVWFSQLRALVHAALVPNHGEMSPESVGDLMEEAGFDIVMNAVTDAFACSVFSDMAGGEAEPETPKADPTPATAGNTTSS